MDIKELIDFINGNKEMFSQLKDPAKNIIDDVKSLFIKESYEQAAKFVAELDKNISVGGGDDRLNALNAAIDALEIKLDVTDDELMQADLNDQIGNLLQQRANMQVAGAFNSVVAFTEDEKIAISDLLTRAGKDIENRKTVSSAIDITVNLIDLAAKICGKVATFGI